MIKVCVTGIAGRMGGRIASLVLQEGDIKMVGATEGEGHPTIGDDVGKAIGVDAINVRVSNNLEEAASKADIIVDFTTPVATLKNAKYSSMTRKPMIIGTTGFSSKEQKELETLARQFPCVISPNMSIGVNVMFEISKQLAQLLGNEFDIEIIEAHHRKKVDSPSATAIKLGEIVADASGREFKSAAKFERYGHIGERKPNEIGIQTIRGGDIVGEHTIMFCGLGERLELTHKALNRDIFARGAIHALRWVVGKPPGIYSMKDVMGI
ncbi:4-hydroxy-tetrahydrodipicolinate reductase [Desulfobacterota bacterium AH_259_B03_O07]|nr:4-hydroxy-tetrahydrodipicolinate reductase [Desulfobacterota bacterium AH_259_B03_O07]